MKTLSLLLLFCLAAFSSAADTWISATITVTNAAGTIPGQTLTVNSDVRTWTNSVSVPASQILTNGTLSGSAANLLSQVSVYPFAGFQIMSAANGFTIRSNGVFTVTLSAGWGAVSFSTNVTTSAISVQMPLSSYTPAQQTNIASALGAAINSPANITLPAGTILPVHLEMTVPVNTTVPITLNVPVDIPLEQTDLHKPFIGLQQVVSPYYWLLQPQVNSAADLDACQSGWGWLCGLVFR